MQTSINLIKPVKNTTNNSNSISTDKPKPKRRRCTSVYICASSNMQRVGGRLIISEAGLRTLNLINVGYISVYLTQ